MNKDRMFSDYTYPPSQAVKHYARQMRRQEISRIVKALRKLMMLLTDDEFDTCREYYERKLAKYIEKGEFEEIGYLVVPGDSE